MILLLNDFRRQWENTREEVLQAVTCVGESGWYVLGKQTVAFRRPSRANGESSMRWAWRAVWMPSKLGLPSLGVATVTGS